jgi:CDP-glucose 4,6-dehydratase
MYEKLKKVYQNKKVFITGHTGFKGSWLLKILSMMGAKIKGYALQPEHQSDLYYTLKGNELCESVIADIRDKNALQNALLDFQPDFIFHFAAQPLVRLSYEIPSETFEVNAIGTAFLLDSIRLLKKKCEIIIITTDKVYHNQEWIYPYRENDRLGGYDPYSASKACTELIIDSYRNSFFNLSKYEFHKKAIAVARAGNVIGGGDWSNDRLIPDIIRFLLKNQTIVIRNPQSIRPWQHVLEPLFGYLQLAAELSIKPLQFSQAYNFGPTNENSLTVESMVLLSIEAWGSGNFKIEALENQPHEAGILKLDISKISNQMNWKPMMSAKISVEKTIEWYKIFNTKPNTIITYTQDQIKYFSHA